MQRVTNIVLAFLLAFSFILSDTAKAQNITESKFGSGISVVARDSSFSMKFSTRFQTLYEGVHDLEADKYRDNLLIRRARLKFDGFVHNPKIQYKIELGLSGSDIGNKDVVSESNYAPLQILDALVRYNFYGNWSLWFGQTKLPGNIERVISSQALQFVDRSFLNSRYNLDRDRGVQLHYSGKLINLKGAVSIGEGRNISEDNAGGYDYTLRAEWFPFGQFNKKGDYIGSDLSRESIPRLMLGVSYDLNDHTNRERGQLGKVLGDTRTLEAVFADLHFKYRGWSLMSEYVVKRAPEGAVVMDGAFYTGTGFNVQTGYLLENNFELALRFTEVLPAKETMRADVHQYTLGVSKYIVGHSLKIQSDLTRIEIEGEDGSIMYRAQVEVSF
ncbi:porin [Imperialibacter roseus]|uniref:Porin n=1 Tax=Imperialibacter roseus TaxID=1324217 RepID=A0ABZ0INY4_9BACT|nr:porin [Imperialibacter roseus]WOK06737.1 porin [Imperialibacter roseus]|tara:strand:- start:10960 stop:12120 length:1161 start_codon:yes stop_codon:yes gene_type:complete